MGHQVVPFTRDTTYFLEILFSQHIIPKYPFPITLSWYSSPSHFPEIPFSHHNFPKYPSLINFLKIPFSLYTFTNYPSNFTLSPNTPLTLQHMYTKHTNIYICDTLAEIDIRIKTYTFLFTLHATLSFIHTKLLDSYQYKYTLTTINACNSLTMNHLP